MWSPPLHDLCLPSSLLLGVLPVFATLVQHIEQPSEIYQTTRAWCT